MFYYGQQRGKRRQDIIFSNQSRGKRKQHRFFSLTTLTKEVMFHRAYRRARPAERRGPWLNNALIPAGNGRSIPRGNISKTRKTSTIDTEYSWSKVSNTRLKSPSSNIEMNRPTRSCKTVIINSVYKWPEPATLDMIYHLWINEIPYLMPDRLGVMKNERKGKENIPLFFQTSYIINVQYCSIWPLLPCEILTPPTNMV